MRGGFKKGLSAIISVVFLFVALKSMAAEVPACDVRQDKKLIPTNPALCESLHDAVRDPSGLALDKYEAVLSQFLGNYCHRNAAAGWVRDKKLRNTGPFITSHKDGEWQGRAFGVHAPVVIWYSPEAIEWIRENRGLDDIGVGSDNSPVPDGAMLIKEMYPAPIAACETVDPLHLFPSNGAAVMIRDRSASHDGWFWGWYGWKGWTPDWPADSRTNRLAYMGFGQYCVNCHASARDNLTFSSVDNIQNEPGEPIAYLNQNWIDLEAPHGHHKKTPAPVISKKSQHKAEWRAAYLRAYPLQGRTVPPKRSEIANMPSQTYDNVWMPAPEKVDHRNFVTSDQCLGCHDAGSTGLQFDMTALDAESGKLLNLSPYATWRTSPMGLAGRDPIFFSQLASETQTFHKESAETVETVCLGCHAALGQRQSQIDHYAQSEECGSFPREALNQVGLGLAEGADVAAFAALGRDGISCMTCHQMAVGKAASEAAAKLDDNTCAKQRQDTLNPHATGLARTFTGSFLMADEKVIYGPHKNLKKTPMKNALGLNPTTSSGISSSEMCGTCHTVHLPVLHRGETVAHIYEQTTFAEWAFSDFRDGVSLYSDSLPSGQGSKWVSCAGCHMRDKRLTESKVASIQEVSNFPAASFTGSAENLDLERRKDYAPHTLVGLNAFLVSMARQFPELLGLRSQDPMMVAKGLDPAAATERFIYETAMNDTADISIGAIHQSDKALSVDVRVNNKVGHKFPSGVGFRRAFIAFEVLDSSGAVLWASGRTDSIGRIVDPDNNPIAGEVWWGPNCTVPPDRLKRPHQPHFKQISKEHQAQIYQSLSAAPPNRDTVSCGDDAKPEGPLTTSFLSICSEVKDNRLLPDGYLSLAERTAISTALGADARLAESAGSVAVGDDPDYVGGGPGGDSLIYEVPIDQIEGVPESVRARLYYQSIPPFYLQDRYCTAEGQDTDRLYWLAENLDLSGTPAEGWKLLVADTKPVSIK